MAGMSTSEQFNKQYDELIDTVKSRAIWRVGEQIVEGEAFRCTCFNCGYESLHQRFDIVRHRLLFGRSVRAIEAPRPMLRCRRCSHLQHLRDVGELVVPSTIALHEELVAELTDLVGAASVGTDLPAEVTDKLARFREEASSPVRQSLLAAVMAGSDENEARTGLLERIGRELFLTTDQIATATSADHEPPSTD